ncbi:MAG: diaminobutyrate acetyltransferase [Candidatus Nitrohelix vancouverensis]|uniref:L-2,4-diaminobutyric acid acetyltransferase n=1 Tax=Candidatus Nitrohelix vancouverensis TaxID=2705534 RepID=A0A7T0C5A3_9BACT|nr:MAG: diaminobutyrate acetyltransferase [Candidatus Nitrohelix vancouverensis]
MDFRKPVVQDGAALYQLAKRSGNLDVNSCYHYVLLCEKFSETCVVAVDKDEPVGFITGFRDPKRQDHLFIWQIAVSEHKRKQGIARSMLNHLLRRDYDPEFQFIETTISPSNAASEALFRSLASDLQCEITVQNYFDEKLFNESGHEEEPLFRIGPLNP